MECQQVSQIINEDGTISQVMGSTETVTISLEDAAQIILQEQVMDGTLQIPPGTYHILTQDSGQSTGDRLIVTGSDGMPVIMQSSESIGNFTVQAASPSPSDMEDGVDTVEGSSMDLLQVDQSDQEMQLTEDDAHDNAETHMELPTDLGDPGSAENQMVNCTTSETQTLLEDDTMETDAAGAFDGDAEAEAALALLPSRKPDLTSPIAVTESTEVVINGKKCVMMMNPETGGMCAYPLLPPEGRRKRGRPRKQIKIEDLGQEIDISGHDLAGVGQPLNVEFTPSETPENNNVTPQEWLTLQTLQTPITVDPGDVQPLLNDCNDLMAENDQTNAAEGLLELAAVGPDGVRRSGRVRRRAKALEDYEILEVSSEDEGAAAPDDDEVTPLGLKKRRIVPKETNTLSPYLLGTGVKRGRGRPRRYPPAGQSNLPTHIPAVIIPTANGQTLMMAPVQGIQNLQAFQEQLKQFPALLQKSSETNGGLGGGEENGHPQMITVSVNSDAITTTESDPINTTSTLTLTTNTDTTQLTTDENNQTQISLGPSEMSAEETQHSKEAENATDGNKSNQTLQITSNANQPTIIQIPENLLPMFLPKKDPIKIGLKASESDLERLRCSKCQFQSYYQQQFQEHLLTNHTESVEKCKCCTYLSLDKNDLLNHFKENHPRCLCQVCGFTSEHAYVLRRHMMRHSADGCTCELCGKTYKDQYILKMHVKMVHLPAEVLYECTVCAKKFTRKAHLKRHLRIHDPEKPYKCPSCDYRGCERSDISKHILIHDEPKHICEVCGKAFRHIKNKELHVKRHKGQRDYKCGVCDFFGYTFTDIRKHIERKHSDVKTLVCDKCGQTFRNETSLIEHQKQKCNVTMIEQALTIATSSGTSEARIQIPTSLHIDGQQITISDHPIPIDGSHMNITMEQVHLTGHPEDDGLSLATEQLTGEEMAIAAQAEEDLEDEEEEDEEDLEEDLEQEEGMLEDLEEDLTGTEAILTTGTTTVTTTPQIVEMVGTELGVASQQDEDGNQLMMAVPLSEVKEVTVLAEESIQITDSSETAISEAGANLIIS